MAEEGPHKPKRPSLGKGYAIAALATGLAAAGFEAGNLTGTNLQRTIDNNSYEKRLGVEHFAAVEELRDYIHKELKERKRLLSEGKTFPGTYQGFDQLSASIGRLCAEADSDKSAIHDPQLAAELKGDQLKLLLTPLREAIHDGAGNLVMKILESYPGFIKKSARTTMKESFVPIDGEKFSIIKELTENYGMHQPHVIDTYVCNHREGKIGEQVTKEKLISVVADEKRMHDWSWGPFNTALSWRSPPNLAR